MSEIAVKQTNIGRPEDWREIEYFDRKTLSRCVGPVKRVPGNDDVLIAYACDGCPRAIGAYCPHEQLPLAEYARAGSRPGTIVCTAHHCEFDVATGDVTSAPGMGSVAPLPTRELKPGPAGSWAVEDFPAQDR
jgi:nitrite reductase/ring-hydroxylating ferredoxin subunit